MPEPTPFDGRSATIIAADTSTDVTAIPEDKVMVAKRVNLANHQGVASRIRIWDSFTDSDSTVHDATTNPILLLDHLLNANESMEILSDSGIFKAIGTIIARATAAGADPNDVTVGVWGSFE